MISFYSNLPIIKLFMLDESLCPLRKFESAGFAHNTKRYITYPKCSDFNYTVYTILYIRIVYYMLLYYIPLYLQRFEFT